MWYGRDIGAHPTAMRFFILRNIERQHVRSRRALELLAANLVARAVHRRMDGTARERHGLLSQRRLHPADHDTDRVAAGVHRIAHIGRHVALDGGARRSGIAPCP